MKAIIIIAGLLLSTPALADDLIHDNSGHLIGRVITRQTDSIKEIRDSDGNLIGTYDPRDQTTRLPDGHIVGYGNLLISLLYRELRKR